jgi:hypothetical protein
MVKKRTKQEELEFIENQIKNLKIKKAKLKKQKVEEAKPEKKKIKVGGLTVLRDTDPDKNKYQVKREQIKVKEKFGRKFIQLLDEKGNIIEEVPKGKETIKAFLDKVKKDGTIKKGLRRVRLQKVTEYNDADLSLGNLKRGERFQYAFTVSYKGQQIVARSTQFHKSDSNIKFAETHALNNLKRKLAYLTNGVSSEDVGDKIIKDNKLKIRKSAIYYRNK